MGKKLNTMQRGAALGIFVLLFIFIIDRNYNPAQIFEIFTYSTLQKVWDETNEKYRDQYHTALTIMILLGKIFG